MAVPAVELVLVFPVRSLVVVTLPSELTTVMVLPAVELVPVDLESLLVVLSVCVSEDVAVDPKVESVAVAVELLTTVWEEAATA